MTAETIKTGLFGGSFNPIHNGHLALAKWLINTSLLDELWFLVSPQNPLKSEKDLLDDTDRLAMVKLALRGESRLKASDYEFHLPKPSYMWHTLQSISHDYPERTFSLIIGADNWTCFDRWFAHDAIIANYDIIIYPRPHFDIDASSLPHNVHLVQTPLIDISSTQIRQRLQTGLPIDELVPKGVAEYLQSSLPKSGH